MNESPDNPQVLTGPNISPQSKVIILCASMKAVCRALSELASVCDAIGEADIGREAQMIRQALDQRQTALEKLLEQADK